MEQYTIENRLKAFCNAYGVDEEHHGSLRLLAAMAYVFGYEISFTLKKVPPPEGEDK